MTVAEKEQFCLLMASLLAPPGRGTVADLKQGGVLSRIGEHVAAWGGDRQLPLDLTPQADGKTFLTALQSEYGRLFGEWAGRVSLVESTYKPWTADRRCGMVFAASPGLVMGDHALHMLELYGDSGLEIPPAYRSTPDHLALELEFLALLYRWATPEQAARFIADHLDWIGALKEAMAKAEPHPFYRSAVELLLLFLQQETRNEERKDHGQNTIH